MIRRRSVTRSDNTQGGLRAFALKHRVIWSIGYLACGVLLSLVISGRLF